MSRFVLGSVLASSLAVLAIGAGCSKSAANQDTPSVETGGSKRIVVPGADEGIPSKGGIGGQAMGGAPDPLQMKGGGVPPAADDRFRLKASEGKLAIEVPADVKPGTETMAKITVTPGEGFHVNTEYPIKLTLQPPGNVTLAKSEFVAGGSDKSKGDAEQLDEKSLVLAVKLTATIAGSYTINGSFKFAVCDHDQCLAKKETIAIAVAAK